MGAQISTPTLSVEDVEELLHETRFTEVEIRKLYGRFLILDKDGSGTLSADEFLAIPEFSMNPLAGRVLSQFQQEQKHGGSKDLVQGENVEVDFRAFAKTLSVFCPATPVEDKLRFAFNVYNTGGDGFIKTNELVEVLRCMVGEQIPSRHLEVIAASIMRRSDRLDQDGRISYAEFCQAMEESDLAAKMSVTL